MGRLRELRQRLRASEREMYDDRDRGKLIVRKIDKGKGMVRYARERGCNARFKAASGIIKEITDLGRELEREEDEAGTVGTAFASDEDKVFSIASKIKGVR